MRWDFHSISQQESVLVDFHRKSNLPVTEIPNLIRIVYLRIGEKLSTRFSKIGMSKWSDFLIDISLQKSSIISETGQTSQQQKLCPSFFTQPDLGPAMPVKERSTGCQSTHCYLIALITIFTYRIIMLFGQSSYSESMSDNLARASSAREYQIELQQVGINTATSPMLNEIAFIFQSFRAKKFERGSLPCHSEGRSRQMNQYQMLQAVWGLTMEVGHSLPFLCRTRMTKAQRRKKIDFQKKKGEWIAVM